MARIKERVKYEVDPHNRLIITPSGKKSEIPKYRYLLDGRFKISKKNSLTYHIKKAQDFDVPQQIKFSGNWSLDKNHNLALTLNKWSNQIAGDKLTIKSEIIDVKGNGFLFAITTKKPDGHIHTYVINLSGVWQADEYNRLSFKVEKEKGPHDNIILEGEWEINKQNQLIYKYTKKNLETKRQRIHAIVFKGYWDITDRLKLSYVLDKELNSRFNFKTSLGIPMRKIDKDILKYEVGIGSVKKETSIKQTITIFGKWRIDKRKGLLFEVEYEDGRIYAIVFGASVKLNEKDNLEVRLKNERNKDLGMDLIFSRKILKGCGEAFLKALSSKKELAIHAGAGFIW